MMRNLSIIFFLCSLSISTLAKDVPSHNPISKVISLVGGDRLTKEMSIILSGKPFGVFTMKNAFNTANEFSAEICGVKGGKRHSRDEVDAVRHFIGSTILAANYGVDCTRALLTAHENRQDNYNDENYMDLANNEVGIELGASLKKITYYKWITIGGKRKRARRYKFDFSREFFTKAIHEKLSMGEFNTLETGESLCARPAIYPNM
jgi:hypothetical protein